MTEHNSENFYILVIKIYQRIIELQTNVNACLSAKPPHTDDARTYQWTIDELKGLLK